MNKTKEVVVGHFEITVCSDCLKRRPGYDAYIRADVVQNRVTELGAEIRKLERELLELEANYDACQQYVAQLKGATNE